MKNTQDFHYNFRISKDIHNQIENIRFEMAKRNIGVKVERTQVIRLLLEKGLISVKSELGIK